MPNTLTDRQIDWVSGPGDKYQTFDPCPPPPCSATIYTSSKWLSTTGSIKVEELTQQPPVSKTAPITEEERMLYEQWSFQAVFEALGHEVREAEDNLEQAGNPVKFKAADLSLGDDAVQVIRETFRIRADEVNNPPASAPAGAPLGMMMVRRPMIKKKGARKSAKKPKRGGRKGGRKR